MKKAGDIRKRRLLALFIGVTIVSAKMGTVDRARAFAAEPEVNKMVITVEEMPQEEQEPPVSIVQEDTILGKIEECLGIIEENWRLILSGDCEDTTSLEVEIETQLSEIERLQNELNTTSYEQISDIRADFEALKSCREKLANVQITEGSDMSSVIGLNEREIKYLLLSVTKDGTNEHLTTDETVAKELADGIVKGAEMYQVNELFAIGVIMWESGWLSNENVLYNNVGNTKRTDKDEFMVYDTLEAGMLATVSAIRNNMKGNNTSRDIAPTYCAEIPELNARWAKSTVSLARKCLNVAK